MPRKRRSDVESIVQVISQFSDEEKRLLARCLLKDAIFENVFWEELGWLMEAQNHGIRFALGLIADYTEKIRSSRKGAQTKKGTTVRRCQEIHKLVEAGVKPMPGQDPAVFYLDRLKSHDLEGVRKLAYKGKGRNEKPIKAKRMWRDYREWKKTIKPKPATR